MAPDFEVASTLFSSYDLACKSNQNNFHGLLATILKKELSGNMFVGVLSSKVNIQGETSLWLVINSLLAVVSSSNAFNLKLNFCVNAIIDDDEGYLVNFELHRPCIQQ